MTYRKFKADYLFTGEDLTGPDHVLITSIDGTVQAVVPAPVAGEDIAYYPGMLCPGFVNCHCHLELSHLRNRIPEKTGLVDFLSSVIRQRINDGGRADDNLAANALDTTRYAIETGEREMLDSGIVAVGDICNTNDTLELKKHRRLYYHNFIETVGFVEKSAPDRWANSLAVYEQFTGQASIVPHAPYSVSPALFSMIAGFPSNQLLTIHNQESEEENQFLLSGQGDLRRLYQQLGLDISFYHGTGKRSLESWSSWFHEGQTIIAVHNVATTTEDLLARKQRGPRLYFCLCPRANLYISGRLPDIDTLLRFDCQIVIGTDSLASNHSLSILEELKTLQRSFPRLTTTTLLQWGTLNGARALGIERIFGSFTPGLRPGVLLLEGHAEKELKDVRARRLL